MRSRAVVETTAPRSRSRSSSWASCARRGARRGRGERHLPHRPDLPRPVAAGAAAGRARPRGRRRRGGGRQRRDAGRTGRPRRHDLRLMRALPALPARPARLLPSFFEHNFASRARPTGRASSRAAATRARALLRPVELRDARRRPRAHDREGPHDIPLEVAAPFGCGIQTGAGSVLNVFRPPAGSSIAVFGAGAVGLAAVLAARIVGCDQILVVDLRPNRLELARELRATAVVECLRGEPRPRGQTAHRRGRRFLARGERLAGGAARRGSLPRPHGCLRRRRRTGCRHRGVARREHDPRRRPRRPWDHRGRQHPRPLPAASDRVLGRAGAFPLSG